MYIVYRDRSTEKTIFDQTRILAIYARRNGAMQRSDQLAKSHPGVMFFVAVLPEGRVPRIDQTAEIIHSSYEWPKGEQNVASQ
jgi:hypothetical protein